MLLAYENYIYTLISAIERLPNIPATKVSRAPKWTDQKGFELLKLYVQYAEFPFFHGLHNNQRRKQSAEKTVQLLLDKMTLCVDGEVIPLAELASLATIWDRLIGKEGRGFSFARNRSILSFIDDEMEGNTKDSKSLYKSW